MYKTNTIQVQIVLHNTEIVSFQNVRLTSHDKYVSVTVSLHVHQQFVLSNVRMSSFFQYNLMIQFSDQIRLDLRYRKQFLFLSQRSYIDTARVTARKTTVRLYSVLQQCLIFTERNCETIKIGLYCVNSRDNWHFNDFLFELGRY